MNGFWAQLVGWWQGGELLMPVMLAVSLLLYGLIGERCWALFGPSSRRRHRRDELERLMAGEREATPQGEREAFPEGNIGRRLWLGRYVAIAEEVELSRGFAAIRALTTALPLLGLLGTVAGMVETFAVIGLAHQPGSLARAAGGGIGLALTATQYGMCLAIPAVICEWVLRRRVAALVHHREEIASGLIADASAGAANLAGAKP